MPVIFVFQFFLNLGISLILARIGFIFPDTAQLHGTHRAPVRCTDPA